MRLGISTIDFENLKMSLNLGYHHHTVFITPKITFLIFCTITLKMKNIAGDLLINDLNQILVVVTSEDCVNIPMGKEDFDNDLDLKTTSLRELREETNYWTVREVAGF